MNDAMPHPQRCSTLCILIIIQQTDTTTLTVCSDGAAAAADSDLEPADTEEDKTVCNC